MPRKLTCGQHGEEIWKGGTDKGMKAIKERKKECMALRCKINHSLLNSNELLPDYSVKWVVYTHSL
jgi:hypothetical protein